MFFLCSIPPLSRLLGGSIRLKETMQLARGSALRATARAMYNTVYPTEHWTAVGF
jgi:hypothetical protein